VAQPSLEEDRCWMAGCSKKFQGGPMGGLECLGWCLPRDHWLKECCVLGIGRPGQKAL